VPDDGWSTLVPNPAADPGTPNPASPASPYEEVVHPDHYQFPNGGEILDVIEHLSFNLGSAIKYLYRAGKKPAVSAQTDLDKAVFYIRREQQRLASQSSLAHPSSASRIDVRGLGPLPPSRTTPQTHPSGGKL
jgi:hypothetical protein